MHIIGKIRATMSKITLQRYTLTIDFSFRIVLIFSYDLLFRFRSHNHTVYDFALFI